MTKKVLAYITRHHQGTRQLLVYKLPHAPLQECHIPGGPLEFGEREEEALYRTIEDASGLIHLQFIQKLAVFSYYNGSYSNSQEYHTFQVESLEKPLDSWKHVLDGFEDFEDSVEVELFWIPLCQAKTLLQEIPARALDHLFDAEREDA
ncbi:hypothetical protein [Pontibacter sp. G13]|uniref:hypothetical protein n=1 Tax=Pontibacter sp. G13 TaxID=3074898 RepID=UPI00288AD3B3|nr:hypothetical protein [Pontibacter sp. G13]WNJ21487.1 hypothetical protein RJD25_13540 [Pontibacter sp. G13]